MLAVNKPLMEAKFSQMLMEESGMLYKAAKEAHYAASKYTYDVQREQYNAGIDSRIEPMGDADNKTKDQWEDIAKEFAKAFVKSLKDAGFDSTLADEIDKHVKSIEPMINFVIPGPAGALAGATGPVTGALIGTTTNGVVQIM